ncbi:hypothetical protein PRUPE_1G179100 [Prunus persica]|uniref:Uncharacterized protein n=2 Tax=Prunus persica TaxID=3760 RepID=A0A251QZ08_PRUPE|nr:hypothetical protein PRUPE_1G179100 [Prunus persica]
MVPKRRSTRILRTRFASTRKDKGEGSGPEVIVTIDDDDDSSDESGAAEAEISTHRQESTHGTSGMDEDPDEGQYYSHDEDTCLDFDIPLEEPGASDMPPEFASDHGQRVDITLVVPTTGYSSEAGLDFPATVADAILGLPAARPPAPPVLGTSDAAADTSPPLPAMPPPTPLILGTSDMAVDASPPLPAVPPLTPLILGTSDMAVDASPPLPAVLPPTEIIDNSHKDGDAFIAGTSGRHSSGKSMSWQDWENSFMAFKAFFDGGVIILRSVDELLSLCHKFNGYVAFQGALVYPETVAVLRNSWITTAISWKLPTSPLLSQGVLPFEPLA